MGKTPWRLAGSVRTGTLELLSFSPGQSDAPEPKSLRVPTMRRFIPFIAVLSLFGVNCSEATSTQLIVLMDTDYVVPAEVDRIRARVAKVVESEAGTEERETWARVFAVSNDAAVEPDAHALPATFAVVPADPDIDRDIVVQLEALGTGSDEVLVTRRVKTGFIPGQSRLVRMLLYRACAESSCVDGESCGCPGGAACTTPSCVDETLPPEELELMDDPASLPPNSEFPIGEDPDGGVGADGGTDPDGGVASDGGAECEPPLDLCNGECVDTRSDAQYCGDCSTVCPSGHVCESSVCADPGDCRTNDVGCTGFTYCDAVSGSCLRGCAEDEQCIRNQEACDIETHECVCASDFERCAFDCVDTRTDPRFCGGCTTSCLPGEVCEAAICVDPGDCRTNGVGCTGFAYCDRDTGNCLRGCSQDTQCIGRDEVCDTVLHECVCAAGFHDCDGVCVSNQDVATCGTSCVPCPAPQGSTPDCAAGVCDFVCNDGLERCGSGCVDTQTDARFCGNCTTSCPVGEVCESGTCRDPGDCRTNGIGCSGFTYCDQASGECLPGCAVDAQCAADNQVCDIVTHDCVCATGFHQCSGGCVSDLDVDTCGTSCVPCLAPPGSIPICDSGSCDFVCNDGFERCDDACCPTSCPPGQVLFERACAATHVRTASADGNVGEYADIALDAAGAPHIAYYARNGRNLLHSHLPTGGLWVRETADSPQDVGQHASIAIDADGSVHIAYYAVDFGDLKHATRSPGGAWSAEIVDAQGDVGQHASLAFDPFGVAHIAYYDEGNKDLLIATQVSAGAWAVATVDARGDVGQYASLAFDPSGVAQIAYYDEGNKDLLTATRAIDETWRLESIESQGDVGRYASLTFDGLGTAHVSYFDEIGLDLKHASRKPGQAWVLQTVDSAGEVGRFTSIVTDAEGHAHIAYYDATDTNLKYAIVAATQQ